MLELRGDEALAVFGSARQALRAAVKLQELYVAELERDPSLPLKVWIGIDAGEATPFEGGYRGRALNLAAPLKDQARAAQVLATEAVIHLSGQVEGLVCIERGFVHPKGIALPVRIVEVAAEGQSTRVSEAVYEAELRTFLMTDIRGFSQFTLQSGDAAAVEFQNVYARLVEGCLQANGGRLLELVSDTAFAVFVSPRQAIQAAMALQHEFRGVTETEQQRTLKLSVGVEAGEAIPTRGKYAGAAVNLTSRICSLAGPGEVLIGETAARLVRKVDGLRFIERGMTEVRGFADPVQILQVVRDEADTSNPSDSP